MKKVVLTLVFGFIGFVSFGSEYNQSVNESDIVQSFEVDDESEVNGTGIEPVTVVNDLTHGRQPLDFSCMLLSCGETVCWGDVSTSDDDILFWYDIYDWWLC
jgi:hypothetical protein